jgi:hypothetical protein
MRSLHAVLAASTIALALAGCSSSTFNPQPDGNITITDATTGKVLQTSSTTPYIVDSGSFSLGIYEDHFGGPYSVKVIQWTAPFNVPCFVPHYVSTAQQTNVVSFTSDNGAPESDPTQPNPCSNNGFVDEETAYIADSKGHGTNFYYQLGSGVPQESFAHRILGH